MNYSLNWLQQQVEQGTQPDYLFFWGHTQKQQAVIDKSCFSQWFPSPFTVDGNIYATAEHWMMAQKAMLFNDMEQLKNILSADDPAEAKKYGRKVNNFDDAVWQQHAYAIVVEGNMHKFSQHQQLQQFLLSTGNTVIVEASPFDKIWGIGTKNYETDPLKWDGTNLLGFALMQVRGKLKNNGEAI